MITLLAIWGWLHKAWLWLRKWGAWVLAGIASLAAVLVYFLRKPAPTPAGPDVREVEDRERRAAEEAKDEVQEQAQAKIGQADHEAEMSWGKSVNDAQTRTDAIAGNTDQTSDFLKQVGDEMRRNQ